MIRLGVIGYGRRMSGFVNSALLPVEPDLRIAAVVDPDEEAARARLPESDREDVHFYETLDEMVRAEDLDGLLIGTRCNLHTPYAIQAAAYDLPLFLEKPVAINMDQAIALEEAFVDSRCPVVVSFPLRVSPLCELTKQLLDEGAVGEPIHVCATNYVSYGTVYWEHEYRNFAITQGLFLQKATHDLDYLTYLMGSPIVRVAAMATYGRVFGGTKAAGLHCAICDETEQCLESPHNRARNRGAGHSLADHPCLFSVDCGSPETGTNEDASSALIEFASGAHGVYTQVFFSRRDAHTRGAIISGYHGTVSFDWYTNSIKRVRHHAPFTDVVSGGAGLSHFGGDIELGRDFLGIITGRIREPRTPIETGLASVYCCLACKQSAETGEFVAVRQVGADRP